MGAQLGGLLGGGGGGILQALGHGGSFGQPQPPQQSPAPHPGFGQLMPQPLGAPAAPSPGHMAEAIRRRSMF